MTTRGVTALRAASVVTTIAAWLCCGTLVDGADREAHAQVVRSVIAPAADWRGLPDRDSKGRLGLSGPRPARFRAFEVDLAHVRERLERAPRESEAGGGVVITLPLPDGRLERFRAVVSPILGPDVVRAHPDLLAFRAVGVDDPTLHARLDLTPLGLRAIAFTPQGVALMDPLEQGRSDRVATYWAHDDPSATFECHFEDMPANAVPIAPVRPEARAAGEQLKTFRFILMATGEYTQSLGGPAQAIAQMTTAMNRVNAIFERDGPVRLEVVQLMAFEDPVADPYASNDVADLLLRNRTVVDSIFGSANYDNTQVISVTPGTAGRSYRPLFCFDGFKGESSVVGPDATSNLFVIKVMPHEIGHTLGATHTQDGPRNRAAETAYEPGSGWTIMSSPGDPQSFVDDYFHAASLEQMDVTLVDPPGCETLSSTDDTPPTVDAGPDYTIPRGTPFVLTGSGVDPDAADLLTFCWEEFDKAPTIGDLALGPLFRSRPPSPSPARAFPALASVLSGVADSLEKLPAVDRSLRFRLTVRDNHPGAAATRGTRWSSPPAGRRSR